MTVDKQNVSTTKSKQIRPPKLPQTSRANSCFVQAKGGIQEKVCAYNERRTVNLTFCLADFVYLIQITSSRRYNTQVFGA